MKEKERARRLAVGARDNNREMEKKIEMEKSEGLRNKPMEWYRCIIILL